MIDRIRDWAKSNPWRFVAIVVAVALVGTVASLVMARRSGSEPIAAFTSATSTTLPPELGQTTFARAPGEPLSVDPNAVSEGLGSAYVSVKVDNAPGARPQVGLAKVQLLVEYPVEGGITRFTAVVNRDATGELGPVRSLRPVDADLLPSLAPYVVSTGGQPFVVQDVAATGISMIDAQLFELFTNGDNAEPVHNLFLLLDELFSTVGDTPALGEGLPAGSYPGGATAAEITLPFESVSYRYEGGAYVRYDAGTQFEVLDAIGGDAMPLAHDAVVVMFVAERSAGYTDGNQAPVTTFDVIGLGDLLVFHQGEVVEGTWLRGAQEDGYRFFDGAGEPFGLPEGRIYVALVPRDAEVGF